MGSLVFLLCLVIRHSLLQAVLTEADRFGREALLCAHPSIVAAAAAVTTDNSLC